MRVRVSREQSQKDERLQTFLTGVAAAVVGVIVVAAFQLAEAAVADTPNLLLTAALFLVGLMVVYFWKSRFNAPVVLVTGAIICTVLLR